MFIEYNQSSSLHLKKSVWLTIFLVKDNSQGTRCTGSPPCRREATRCAVCVVLTGIGSPISVPSSAETTKHHQPGHVLTVDPTEALEECPEIRRGLLGKRLLRG